MEGVRPGHGEKKTNWTPAGMLFCLIGDSYRIYINALCYFNYLKLLPPDVFLEKEEEERGGD